MSGVRIRPLETDAERRAAVALQDEVWGDGFSDRVPASILLIAAEMGGVASGAFAADRLVGFVFGISGWRAGRAGHWSDMLAVHPAFRGRGVGVALKRHQRELLLGLGVSVAWWTFDPLVARNAHLNLDRLGATATEYRRELYGDSDSPLHAGIGTDRLIAEWDLRSRHVSLRLDGSTGPSADPDEILNPPEGGGAFPRPSRLVGEPSKPRIGIVVPGDLMALKAEDLPLALAWRGNVREAFEACFARGYRAVGFRRQGATGTYILSRDLVR